MRWSPIRLWNHLMKLGKVPANQVPDRASYAVAINDWTFKGNLIDCSIQEDYENSYYTGILNTLSEHCCGSMPIIVGNSPNDTVNDFMEDRWLSWGLGNGVGSVIRQLRRSAARTGIGIAIPYINAGSPDPIKLAYKTVCVKDLETPPGAGINDRIIDGIEYDKTWSISKIYVRNDGADPTAYSIEDIVVWSKQTKEGLVTWAPECGPAFTLYPSVKRVMEAIVKAEEFRSSVPMAIELDPTVWGRDAVSEGTAPPTGTFKYDPGTIPTLPPGTKLSGLPTSVSGDERTKFIELVIGAAARCIQMPKNLALGDSSNHNMSSSQVDMQPWFNKIKIDRADFEPAVRKIVSKWMERAVLIEGYLPPSARKELSSRQFTYTLNYDSIFQHPDPNKNASARSVDLLSGAGTLTRIYKDMGLNAKRELRREAQLYGISYEEYMQILLATRTKETLQILQLINTNVQQAQETP